MTEYCNILQDVTEPLIKVLKAANDKLLHSNRMLYKDLKKIRCLGKKHWERNNVFSL